MQILRPRVRNVLMFRSSTPLSPCVLGLCVPSLSAGAMSSAGPRPVPISASSGKWRGCHWRRHLEKVRRLSVPWAAATLPLADPSPPRKASRRPNQTFGPHQLEPRPRGGSSAGLTRRRSQTSTPYKLLYGTEYSVRSTVRELHCTEYTEYLPSTWLLCTPREAR